MPDVSIVACPSYESKTVQNALKQVLEPFGGLSWVRPGMCIVIKANLVSMMKPEKAATTHPALLSALVELLVERGAEVIVGDSPGGLYNQVFLNRVYSATGMKEVESVGATLNTDFSIAEAHFEKAEVMRDFVYTAYLDRADAIINFCKLKTHGMMGMSGAVKNMFGVIPGTYKPEYHFRFPEHADFARMLVELNVYFKDKIKLCLMDAVVGMEGNGPTQGTPRQIGALLAAETPYPLDLAGAFLIGLGKDDVPTIEMSCKMGFIPESAEKLEICGALAPFVQDDYKNIHVHRSLQFEGKGKFAAMFVRTALRSEPRVNKRECIGCKKCAEICPAKAIVMRDGKPIIDRRACITCFCCQEFCPKGAMKVHRPLIARLVNRKK